MLDIYLPKDITREFFLNTMFPFTLHRCKSQATSRDVLISYERATKRLAERLDTTAKFLASREGEKPNKKYQLDLLEEIKKTL